MLLNIACSSDEAYVPHTAAMLNSLRNSNPRACIDLHYLYGHNLSAASRWKLNQFCKKLDINVSWVEVPQQLITGLPGSGYISDVVWHRIFMPELMPQLDRVLYLDCDVLVLDQLDELYTTDLGKHYFGAVTNIVPEKFRHRARELGLPGPEAYFNAGVALWNLDILRRENFTNTLLEYVEKHLPQLLWLEQDAMNALFWSKRLNVHPRWNVQNGIFASSWGTQLLPRDTLAETISHPGIIHFEGGAIAKPWHFLSNHPYKQLYTQYRAQSPWPLLIPDGLTLKNVFKRFAPKRLYAVMREARDLLKKNA